MTCASCFGQAGSAVAGSALIPAAFAAVALVLLLLWQKIKLTLEQYLFVVGGVVVAAYIGALISGGIVEKVAGSES